MAIIMQYDHIEVLFIGSSLPFARIIEIGTLSSFSHVAIVDPDNAEMIFEATMLHGVVHRERECLKNKKIVSVALPIRNIFNVIRFLRNQVGKKYDWGGLFGGVFRTKKWNDTNSWYCSELWLMCSIIGGYSFFEKNDKRTVYTPDQLYIATRQHMLKEEGW